MPRSSKLRKVCTVCRQYKLLDDFYYCKHGISSACKACQRKARRAYYLANRDIELQKAKCYRAGQCHAYYKLYAKTYVLTIAGCYSSYKCGAKKRGLAFRLTLKQFAQFWKKPCTYCGSAINTVGLDRINSARGYFLDNVAPCCTICNRMKLDYTVSNFVRYCERVVKNKKRKQGD
jgi:hypothetical protein